MKIFITGGRSFVAFELMRGFAKDGHKVYIGDSLKTYICKDFHYYEKAYLLPSCRFDFEEYCKAVLKIVKRHEIEVIIPTCEEVFYISKMKDKLDDAGVMVLTSDIETLNILHNKYLFSKFCEHSPETMLLDENKNTVEGKFITKKCYSRFGEHVRINDTNVKIKEAQWITQKYVEGKQICTYGFAMEGVLKFNICYTNESKGGKAATSFIAFSDKKINLLIQQMVRELNYTGNISFDIIKNCETYYFIECNPRVTSGVHTLCYNNFYNMFFGNIKGLKLCKRRVKVADIIYNKKISSRGIYDVFAGEKKGTLSLIKSMIHLIIIGRKEGISMAAASTFDIEWNGDI